MIGAALFRSSASGGPRLAMRLALYVALTLGAIIMLMPFVWMASTACKPDIELNKLPVRWLLENPTCGANLREMYDLYPNFNRYMLKSAIVTNGPTLGQLVISSLAAYGFARFKFQIGRAH